MVRLFRRGRRQRAARRSPYEELLLRQLEQRTVLSVSVDAGVDLASAAQVEPVVADSTVSDSLPDPYQTPDGQDQAAAFRFEQNQESQGTQKLFAIAGPILDTLKLGKTLFIDELDTRLHPLLTQYLIRLFNSRKSNAKNAQLIFATHDTNLLSSRFFRRDQIWFTEKDNLSTTDLYSLSDFKVRKDATFNKDYIMGKYGAIPYITQNSFILGEGSE